MSALLFGHLPVAATPLPARDLPLRLPPEKAAAIACGTVLAGLALVWGVTWGVGRSAQDEPPPAVTGDAAPTPSDGPGVPPPPPAAPVDPAVAPAPAAPGEGIADPQPPAFQMKTKAGGGAPPAFVFKH